MIGGVAAAAAVRTWPFRVYSFPSAPIAMPIVDWDDIANFSRPELLIRGGGILIPYPDGSDLGRGSGTSYRRVFPYDDLKKLFAEGWRDPRLGTFGNQDSRSRTPFRVGVT